MRRALLAGVLVLLAGCAGPTERLGILSVDENETAPAQPDPEPAEEPAADATTDAPPAEPTPEEAPADELANADEPVAPEGEPVEEPALAGEPEEPPAETEPTSDEAAPVDAEVPTEPASEADDLPQAEAPPEDAEPPAESNETPPPSGGDIVAEPEAETEPAVEAPAEPNETLILNGSAGGERSTSVASPEPTGGAPRPSALVLSEDLVNNSGQGSIVVRGRVVDEDGESTVRTIAVRVGGVVGAAPLGANHTTTLVEREREDEPEAFDADGFKIWGGEAGDDTIHFAYRLDVPRAHPAGLYVVRVVATDADENGGFSPGAELQVTDFTRVQASSTPVDASGAPLAGASWGGWRAQAGAKNVTATNWLKLVNAGTEPNATVRLAFTGPFVGADDPRYQIPVKGNLELAWWEDTTPSSTSPREGEFRFEGAAADGTAEIRFSGVGHVVYVTYRFREMPSVLALQSYGAPYTLAQVST